MKNVNYILFYRVLNSLSEQTTVWIRNNSRDPKVKESCPKFKSFEEQLSRVITDRKNSGIKYKTIPFHRLPVAKGRIQ